MRTRLDTTTKKVIVGALVIALVCFLASLYVKHEEAAMTAALETKLEEQSVKLTMLADLLDRDGADEMVSSIVKDCSQIDRERFDYLLSNLQTLKGVELKELDLLFARCSSFYAERRAMMVSRLKHELSVYLSFIELYSSIDGKAKEIGYPTKTWDEIVLLEGTRAGYTRDLVTIQGEIITHLIAGKSVSSESISTLLQSANETKENLSLAGVQLDALLQELP